MMKYLKTINVLDGATDQPSKLRTSKWIEINNESKGKYDNSNIRFKTSMIKSNLSDCSNAYILVKGTITAPKTAAARVAVNNTNERVIFKNCAPFTNGITKTNNMHK